MKKTGSYKAWVIVLVAMAACTFAVHAQSTGKYAYGIYRGTLPCADCPGIETTLTLYAKGPNILVDTSYRLECVYKEKPPETKYVSTGTWIMSKGTPDLPRATVLQLDGDKGEGMAFLRIGQNDLQALDQHFKPIDPPGQHILHKVTPPHK